MLRRALMGVGIPTQFCEAFVCVPGMPRKRDPHLPAAPDGYTKTRRSPNVP
ncbi:hypothetical protein MGG_17562 [Pyricularia oryzae 70-15]|uniref:Uncharacterized protein n=2 Tax=Pyricularia oryzae TaxID=318829 RepID=G4NFH7_PYRO7|nr:uncharacterized protein MGG_17562 [Pyricularia oryzae 70-15]EHA46784.1 hypothetical protein MGG_17562 [Pyricularia oryzae 70-15]ELQ32708.1 hypothetical protein OOU_Y34scaffold01073g26 [Pyricularia oryzae Y34]